MEHENSIKVLSLSEKELEDLRLKEFVLENRRDILSILEDSDQWLLCERLWNEWRKKNK